MAGETKLVDPVDDRVNEQARDLNDFDYGASAELFMSRSRAAKRLPSTSGSTPPPKRCVSWSRSCPPRCCQARISWSQKPASEWKKFVISIKVLSTRCVVPFENSERDRRSSRTDAAKTIRADKLGEDERLAGRAVHPDAHSTWTSVHALGCLRQRRRR